MSPGLVVMGDDSCMKGLGSNPYTGWTFFISICCKNGSVCLKRQKINKKEAGVGPLKIALTMRSTSRCFEPSIPCQSIYVLFMTLELY